MTNFNDLKHGDILIDDEWRLYLVADGTDGHKHLACRTWLNINSDLKGDTWIRLENFDPTEFTKFSPLFFFNPLTGSDGIQVTVGEYTFIPSDDGTIEIYEDGQLKTTFAVESQESSLNDIYLLLMAKLSKRIPR